MFAVYAVSLGILPISKHLRAILYQAFGRRECLGDNPVQSHFSAGASPGPGQDGVGVWAGFVVGKAFPAGFVVGKAYPCSGRLVFQSLLCTPRLSDLQQVTRLPGA